jgi:hypothetical protein
LTIEFLVGRVQPKVSGGGAPRSPAKAGQAWGQMTISSQKSWFRWCDVSEGERGGSAAGMGLDMEIGWKKVRNMLL